MSFASYAKPCHIEAFPKILKINRVLDATLVKASDCESNKVKTFTRFLSGASGEMRSSHLSRMFKNEYGFEIKFKNDIEVIDLKDFISEELGLGDAIITKLTSLYGKASLNLRGDETFSVECPSCSSPGERNIKLKINGKTIWLSSKIKIKRSGYRLTKDASPFNKDFGAAFVEPATALDDGKALIFKSPEKLKYFRPARPLSKGQTLKQNDLLPRTLVRFNHPVDVILKGKNISLKTKATSRQNGKYGETIKLYNPKSRKNILGTVIDFNTVMVEL